jgi:hypothetical protein
VERFVMPDTRNTLIIPGLAIEEEHFELAAAALSEHAPHRALTWEAFTRPTNWWLVPDPGGKPYKAEFELIKTKQRTIKINIWFAPDLRRDGTPQPHNHPRDFNAFTIAGGYEESRFARRGSTVDSITRTHSAGDVNAITRAEFHEVVAIHDPGRTMSLMVCGEWVRGSWGHLEPDTGRVQLNDPAVDPGFNDRLYAINPQHTRRPA